jgi:hypothetical protein
LCGIALVNPLVAPAVNHQFSLAHSLPTPSGHFHLSHNYADAISVVGGTAFVLTGVIGECNRDGFRHSRLLKGAVSYVPCVAPLLGSRGVALAAGCCMPGTAA